MNPARQPLVWWALIGALLISSGVALTSELSKRRALAHSRQTAARLSEVEQERDRLNQELGGIRQSMQEQAGRLAQLQAELSRTEQEVNRLRLDYARLQQSNTTLNAQLADATQTTAALEAKLSSIQGLKLAIRELRSRQWRSFLAGNWQRWMARAHAQRARDERQLAHGNRGLLVRNGISTIGSRTTLQVRVLEPQSE